MEFRFRYSHITMVPSAVTTVIKDIEIGFIIKIRPRFMGLLSYPRLFRHLDAPDFTFNGHAIRLHRLFRRAGHHLAGAHVEF